MGRLDAASSRHPVSMGLRSVDLLALSVSISTTAQVKVTTELDKERHSVDSLDDSSAIARLSR
jgi:hypothetical protein